MEGSIANLTESLGNADQKLAIVSDRLTQLEAQSIQPKRGRRTLASGGQEE